MLLAFEIQFVELDLKVQGIQSNQPTEVRSYMAIVYIEVAKERKTEKVYINPQLVYAVANTKKSMNLVMIKSLTKQ